MFVRSHLVEQEIWNPVLEIGFGSLSADFGSIWSPQKVRKFRHVQKTSKVRTLYFDLQSLKK